MMIQKSSSSITSTLYLVPTPIGNIADMTPRAIEVLNNVDVIFAEDTRVTKVVLSHFNIGTKLKSYHIFNEDEVSNDIIDLLKSGNNIAIVSDAGMPAISDPGYLIVRKALDENINVISLPGANAALTALIASGLPCERFYFYGFLKHKKSQKEKELHSLIDFKDTLIFYESPHRIKETIEIMYEVFRNRRVAIARELTKKFEEYIRGDLENVVKTSLDLKGEIVIVVSGATNSSVAEKLNDLSIQEHLNYYLENGYEKKEAMKLVAKDRGVSKSEVYKEIIND